MLESFHIKNFKLFEDLEIKSLSRVNLITGKNNTGKTSLLEALTIYVTKGDIKFLVEFIEGRGENFNLSESDRNKEEIYRKAFITLFPNNFSQAKKIESIILNAIEKKGFSIQDEKTKALSIRFVNNDSHNDIKGIELGQLLIERIPFFSIGLEINFNDVVRIYSLNHSINYSTSNFSNIQYISSNTFDSKLNPSLWDKIYLTPKEDFVFEALKIINPNAEKIGFVGDDVSKRKAILKSSEFLLPVPLKSMGDGINRILTIILALVNAENGYLFIDEFENGLHHTAQTKLWEIIFKLAEKLNVQVFATTHSEDCISGFEHALNSADSKVSGEMIKLYNKNGIIKQVQYIGEDLKVSLEHDIEIR